MQKQANIRRSTLHAKACPYKSYLNYTFTDCMQYNRSNELLWV